MRDTERQRFAENAVRRLNAIDARDPEKAHAEAEEILLEQVPIIVRAAYMRLVRRARWWAAG